MDYIGSGRYRLSSGREFRANNGIVGLGRPEFWGAEPTMGVTEGYDGGVDLAPTWNDDNSEDWTLAERRELADYMIAQWQAWGAKWSEP